MLKLRSAGDSHNGEATVNDTDAVELEKSNILLMGPTGSGIYKCLHFYYELDCYDAYFFSIVAIMSVCIHAHKETGRETITFSLISRNPKI